MNKIGKIIEKIISVYEFACLWGVTALLLALGIFGGKVTVKINFWESIELIKQFFN